MSKTVNSVTYRCPKCMAEWVVTPVMRLHPMDARCRCGAEGKELRRQGDVR